MSVAKASLDVVVKRKFTFSFKTRNRYLQSVTTLLAELSHRLNFFNNFYFCGSSVLQ